MKKYVIILMITALVSGCSNMENTKFPAEEITEITEMVEATEEVLAEGFDRFESKNGFSVVYPVDWDVSTGENIRGIEGCEFYVKEPASESNISIAVCPFDPYINEMTRDMMEKGFAELGVEVEVNEFFRGLRHGMKTVEMEYTFLGLNITQISFVDGEVYYNLVYTRKEGITEENEAVMQEIINSVKKIS